MTRSGVRNYRATIGAAVGFLTLVAHAPSARAQDRSAGDIVPQPVVYTILRGASVLQVHTYKAGILGAFSHEHDIRAHAFAGTVVYDARDPSRSRVSVTVWTDSLRVVPAKDSSDIPAITAAMREHVLHVESFPTISFASTQATVRDSTVHLSGDLTMVGNTRPVEMDLTLRVASDTLYVGGSFTVKQTDFGIRPYSAAGGTVKVKNDITFVLDIRSVAAR